MKRCSPQMEEQPWAKRDMEQAGHMMRYMKTGFSLAERILQYAERATQSEGKVNELESRLAALEMGPPPNTTTNWILCPTNGI